MGSLLEGEIIPDDECPVGLLVSLPNAPSRGPIGFDGGVANLKTSPSAEFASRFRFFETVLAVAMMLIF
jgi:hypothetical protein